MTSLLIQPRRPWAVRVSLFCVFILTYFPPGALSYVQEGPEYSALFATADTKTGPGQSRMTLADYGGEELLKDFPNVFDDFTLLKKDSLPCPDDAASSCKANIFYEKDYRICAKDTAPERHHAPCLMPSDYLNSINNKTGKMYKWTTKKRGDKDIHVWEGRMNYRMTEQEQSRLPLDERDYNNPPNNLAINPFAPAPFRYSTRNSAQCARTPNGKSCPSSEAMCDDHAEAKDVVKTCSKCSNKITTL